MSVFTRLWCTTWRKYHQLRRLSEIKDTCVANVGLTESRSADNDTVKTWKHDDWWVTPFGWQPLCLLHFPLHTESGAATDHRLIRLLPVWQENWIVVLASWNKENSAEGAYLVVVFFALFFLFLDVMSSMLVCRPDTLLKYTFII